MGALSRFWAADVLKRRIAHRDLYRGTFQAVLAQPDRHPRPPAQPGRVRSCSQPTRFLGKGQAVAHRFGARHIPGGHHRGVLFACGIVVEGIPPLSQNLPQAVPVKPSQIADGAYPIAAQHPGRRPAHKEQIGHRKRPEQLLKVFPGDDRGGVRLFIVAAHFGKYLIKGDPHRHRQAQLLPHRPPDLVGQGLPSPPKRWRVPVTSSQLSSMEKGSTRSVYRS